MNLSTYQNLTFEEATRILYWHYCDINGMFKSSMEVLMNNADSPYKVITPLQYDEYREATIQNKKSK